MARGVPQATVRERNPTPEEIRRACAEIRAGWSEAEFYTRSGEPIPWFVKGAHKQQTVPVTHVEVRRMSGIPDVL